jgi:adenylate cyclase
VTVAKVRLLSGLVLVLYLTTHFTNHALGLVSLSAMNRGLWWFLLVWRSVPGTLALYGALVVHVALAFWSLYRRRHLRMPAWETWQLGLGLVIPPLLVDHIIGTRIAFEMFDVTSSYTRVVLAIGYLNPTAGIRQTVVLLLAWTHACIGLHFWLRFRPWYPRVAAPLFGVAVLLPTLALLGFYEAAREVAALAATPGWVQATLAANHAPARAQAAALAQTREVLATSYTGLLLLVLVVRAGSILITRRAASIRVTYPDGRVVVAPRRFTLLEVSRFAGIPHASVCGGRGRCSTCRVRVVAGLAALPPPSPGEARVLQRIGAGASVRLACQTRPTGDVAVVPLVAAGGAARSGAGQGREQEIAVLFADLRNFTTLAEQKLPYDVVFFLNRYFEAVATAIKSAGGVANQFTGDGVMALFGIDTDGRDGSRRAMAAAQAMVDRVAALSRDLADELPAPLRIGIGIHTGPAVVGRMGYDDSTYLTAVGDTVHVAARLEQLTKEYAATLVVSEQVGLEAGLDLSAFPRYELTLRNRGGLLAVRVIDDIAKLAVR